MQIEVFSHPRARCGAQHGDDVALVCPGLGFAVFDGATDPSGAQYNGQSGGRMAAEAAAMALILLLARDGKELAIDRIGDALSEGVAAAARAARAIHPPSTTLAAAIETKHGFRLLVIGDSGIRINGDRLLRPDKLIDTVSVSFRIALREVLFERIRNIDALEMACRAVVTSGLEESIRLSILSTAEVSEITRRVQAELTGMLSGVEDDLQDFLRLGLLSQPHFANRPDHPFGYASIIGTPPRGFGIVEDFLAFEEFQSLEIFTDGYFDLPHRTRVADWERRFAEVEELDPAKTGPFRAVKGSTSTEFSDDRTIICLNRH